MTHFPQMKQIAVSEENIDEVLSNYAGWNASILKEAIAFGCTAELYPESEILVLHKGAQTEFFWSMHNSLNSAVSAQLSNNKFFTNSLLGQAGIPVPNGVSIGRTSRHLIASVDEQLRYPLVAKPLKDTYGGSDVYVDIRSADELDSLLDRLFQKYERILIEDYYPGRQDYRLLVLDGVLIAATRRVPAYVIGDGVHSVQALIDKKNEDRQRLAFVKMGAIPVNDSTHRILEEQGVTLDAVLAEGQKCQLGYAANAGQGGEFYDVTDEVHPDNAALVVRAAEVLGLRIAGFDVLAQDISQPIRSAEEGVIIEANEYPGITCHSYPNKGESRPVERLVLEALFRS